MLSGLIFWENVGYNEDGLLDDVDAYLTNAKLVANETERQLIKTELGQLQNNINNKIALIEADTTVQYCMTGREVQGMKVSVKGKNVKAGTTTRTKIGEKSEEAARFPELTKQMRMIIANAALKKAKDNYYKKYEYKGMLGEVVDKLYKIDLTEPTTLLRSVFLYDNQFDEEYNPDELEETMHISDPNPLEIEEPLVYIYNSHQLENYSNYNLCKE